MYVCMLIDKQRCITYGTLRAVGSCEYSYQFSTCKQGHFGRVRVQTDLVFTRSVGREGEPSLRPILAGKNNLEKRRENKY